MSSSDRGGQSALVVLALLVASIILVAFLGLYARHEANYQVGCYNQKGLAQHSTVCPDDFLYFGDGLAQWVMSVFAVVATAVSIAGLIWIRQTLIATQITAKAAVDAAEMARAAVGSERAWMTVSSINMADLHSSTIDHVYYERGYGVQLVWRNDGRSPAIRTKSRVQKLILPSGSPPVKITLEMQGMFGSVVGPAREIMSDIMAFSPDVYDALLARKLVLHVYNLMEYEDTFNPGVARVSEVYFHVDFVQSLGDRGLVTVGPVLRPIGDQNTAS